VKTKKVAIYGVGLILGGIAAGYIWLSAGVVALIAAILLGVLGVGIVIGIDYYYQRRVEEADKTLDNFLEEEKEKNG